MEKDQVFKTGKSVVFFDGVCNLCNHTVQSLLRLDKSKKMLFSSLQSDYGQFVLHELGLPQDHFDSLIFMKSGKIYQMSDAVLEISWELGGMYRLFYVFKIIPSNIRHGMYRVIARNRYRWFGKKASCQLLTPDLAHRFIE